MTSRSAPRADAGRAGQMIQSRAQYGTIGSLLVVAVVVSLLITVFGYNMIHGLNRWLAIVFGVTMVLIVILTVAHGLPAHFFSAGKFSWTAFVSAAVTTGVLWQIAYAPYVSDYSRYMPADKGVRPTFWFSYAGVVLGSAGPMMIGALVGLASTSSNLVAEIDKLTGGIGWLVKAEIAPPVAATAR
jgi:NCS1 family nucleobase:cation symporter-1